MRRLCRFKGRQGAGELPLDPVPVVRFGRQYEWIMGRKLQRGLDVVSNAADLLVADVAIEGEHDAAKSRALRIGGRKRRIEFDGATEQVLDVAKSLDRRKGSDKLSGKQPFQIEIVRFGIRC